MSVDNSIVIYKTSDNQIDVQIDYQTDTIWLNKKEIAKLFCIDRSGVSRHINNIFKTGELEEKSNVQKMHIGYFIQLLICKYISYMFGDNLPISPK